MTQNQVSCRQAEYFTDPEKFVPERWIKSHPYYKQVSPYLVLPFGHGPRSCIARRLAEQNLHSVILKVSYITASFVQTYVFKTTVLVEIFWSKSFVIEFYGTKILDYESKWSLCREHNETSKLNCKVS